jgi:hypothetical protein
VRAALCLGRRCVSGCAVSRVASCLGLGFVLAVGLAEIGQ